MQERDSDQVARFAIEVEAAAPYHVTHLEIRAMGRPAEFALPRLSQVDLVDALRAKLEKDTASDKFSGAVLLAKDGKAVFTGAYGMGYVIVVLSNLDPPAASHISDFIANRLPGS